MPSEQPSDLKFEIGHVLFVDIVGYSKLSIDEQSAQLATLKTIVRGTEQYRQAEAEGKFLRLPTGDGVALVFRDHSESPVLCAMEISRALRSHSGLGVRMGIHSGPVNEIADLNQQANVAGAGINYAQRVMDCGDAGHILVSRHVAEDLETFDRWKPLLHDLGECEVKHGVRVGVTNLYADEFGNSKLPGKIQAIRKRRSRVRKMQAAMGLLVIGAVAAAFVMASRRPPASSTAVPEKSIAVLPFVDMSQAKDQEFFSDGISEELLNVLAKVPQLRVAARTSSFSFKGKQVEIREIARQLHVANVLEGSVRKSGDQVRITAQLIRAAEGYHLWSETYDRKLDDIFKVQDEIAAEVVKQLKVTLLGAPPTVRQTDPKAYALFLQAKQLARQSTPEAFEKSDALYRQVLEIDPRYAPAWERLATNFINKAGYGMVPSQEGLARARELAEKALAIDPDYAPAHDSLGYIAVLENDAADAAKHYERALTLDPTDLGVVINASGFLTSLGRLDEALALDEAIVRRDPVNKASLANLGGSQRFSGKYDEAIASYRTALNLIPGAGGLHSNFGMALLLKGDAAGALAEIEQEPIEALRMLGLPMAYFALGRKADSDNALAAVIAKYEKDASYNIACIYAFRGEADQAFSWLDKAIDYHDPGLAGIVPENLFDKIHSDRRWLPFLRKIGKAPEQLAKIKFEVTLPPE